MKTEWLSPRERAALQLVGDHVPVGLWSASRELELAWGLGAPSFAGLEDHVRRALLGPEAESPALVAHRQALGGTSASFDLDWQGRRLEIHVDPVQEAGGEVTGVVALAVDQQNGTGATRGIDTLTGLADRRHFLARLRRSAAPGWCLDGLFVLLVDLDRFHDVNERFGYEVGDRLLAEVATRLRRRLRPTDVVSRFGADSFAALLGGVRSGPDVARVAERLLAALSEPFEAEGVTLKPTASIGIAVGMAGARAEDIVREAERALARAKVLGRPAYLLSSPAADAREASLLQVETALRRALEQEDISARYRPVVSRKEGKVAGFEVVLWRRAAEGELPPLRPRPRAGARVSAIAPAVEAAKRVG